MTTTMENLSTIVESPQFTYVSITLNTASDGSGSAYSGGYFYLVNEQLVLQPGDSSTQDVTATVPTWAPVGDYYIVVEIVDGEVGVGNDIDESNNKIILSTPITVY